MIMVCIFLLFFPSSHFSLLFCFTLNTSQCLYFESWPIFPHKADSVCGVNAKSACVKLVKPFFMPGLEGPDKIKL